jgi:osmotically-inducible protein OsmY
MEFTDEKVKKDVIEQLYWDGRVDASGIQVIVIDGHATLKGVVPTYASRKAAVNDTWIVPGVESVTDHLLVRYTVETPPDEELARSARSMLIWSPDIASDSIQVTVNAGLVTLEGTTDAYWKRTLAEDLIANIGGVLAIRNMIVVVPAGRLDDEEIAGEVLDALDRNDRVDAGDLSVKVENGVVTVTGSVPDRVTRREVSEIAGRTGGVVELHNELAVLPGQTQV